MGAVVDQPAGLEEQHLVGEGDGGRPVGHHQRGGAGRARRAAPRGCGPRWWGRPPRWRRRAAAAGAGAPGPGPGRPAGAGRPRAWRPARPRRRRAPPCEVADEPVGAGQRERRLEVLGRPARAARSRRRCRRTGTPPGTRWRPRPAARRRRCRRGRGRRGGSCRASGSSRPASRSSRVDLPQPVGPTTATVRPGSTVKDDAVEHGGARLVGEGEPVDLEAGAARPVGRRRAAARRRGGGRPARPAPAGCGRGRPPTGAARRARSRSAAAGRPAAGTGTRTPRWCRW